MIVKSPSTKTEYASRLINLETYTKDEDLIVSKENKGKTYIGRVYAMSPLVGGGGEFAIIIQNIFKSCPDDSVVQVNLMSGPDHDAPEIYTQGKTQGGAMIQELVNDTATSLKSNSNSTTLGAGASATASTNKGAGLGASLRGDTATTATDTMNRTTSAGKTKSIEEAQAVEKAISDELREAKTSGRSTDAVKALEAMYSKQQQYTSSLSETTSSKDGSGITDQNSNQLVSFAQSYSSESLAHAVATNPAMRDFQLTEGRSFENNPAVARHMRDAAQMVESGASEQVRGSPLAHQAAIRHNAAVRLLNDADATADAKKSAADYLVNQGMAVTGLRQSFGGTDRLRVNLGRPEDATGVDGRNLEERTNKLIPSMPAAKPTHRTGAKPTTATPSSGGSTTTIPTGLNTATLPEVRDAFNKTDAAGLNQDSTKGTVRRAAENAVGNIANTFAGGRNERVSLGRLDSE